jgi:hypothetical protein
MGSPMPCSLSAPRRAPARASTRTVSFDWGTVEGSCRAYDAPFGQRAEAVKHTFEREIADRVGGRPFPCRSAKRRRRTRHAPSLYHGFDPRRRPGRTARQLRCRPGTSRPSRRGTAGEDVAMSLGTRSPNRSPPNEFDSASPEARESHGRGAAVDSQPAPHPKQARARASCLLGRAYTIV